MAIESASSTEDTVAAAATVSLLSSLILTAAGSTLVLRFFPGGFPRGVVGL